MQDTGLHADNSLKIREIHIQGVERDTATCAAIHAGVWGGGVGDEKK